jgi:hypothetical protein
VIVTTSPATVAVPERSAPLLAETVTVTPPEPVPDGALTVRKLLLLTAVQPQFAPCVLTAVTLTVPPPAVTAAVVGVTSNTHSAGVPAAACATVTV